MRRWLFLASAACLVVAVALATSSAARRTLSPRGADIDSHVSSSSAPVPVEPSTPALATKADRATVGPARSNASAAALIAHRPALGSMGMIVAIDPETGRIGMPQPGMSRALTTDELQALARAEAEGLVTIRNPDGSETLNHEGRFADRSIVRVGPDGKPIFECVHGEAEVDHALHADPTARPAAEEE